MGRAAAWALVPIAALAAASAATLGVPREREAGACSCVGPRLALLSPDRVDDAPLNARVRVEVPANRSAGGAPGKVVLRAVGGGEVAVTTRTFKPGGWVELAELTPKAPLAPSTQYELALLDPEQYPSTVVFGTFRTGVSADTTAPRLERLGPAVVHRNAQHGSGSCQIAGPWVTFENVGAVDPARAGAQLSFGVWVGDAAGRVDTSKPPVSLVSAGRGAIAIGRTSLCDPHDFPLPKAGPLVLGVAAIDEAGNASAARTVRVNLAGGVP
jgi:hypothetical protein